ncbi:MAG: hypothetical protein GW906_03250 [Epsilonproteobacteria bacterium]|nr:hypothetical protein [Campylobacterota bacterium]OIO16045.1 MAG: hypothetical protein AUJ81_05145 [Helicobacteraceae bacterium CG1_02_36_14]PIS26438.1 MAG: hypothetical protein COT46_02305 [Sulfurimonas sp. CG08_land_8_20_14_0_20_36_33]PIW23531.1 MAG: hypothetical protein COW31_10665 [Sulfurimonas sp. CG15_BIG_FIL_POST_REV_8_21_14_020_36_339]PIX63352.1 MAG: hypothetical protein COZ44_08455 [Sulfurimonas sp. CG_4_10_14_3_um_filter_36_910]PJE72518.1 MAG: hypothetical protein COU99_00855 [Sulf
MNQNTLVIQEDEIDLRELFLTLIKNKMTIVLITSAITIAGALHAYTKTPIFEVKSTIQIGHIGESLIDDPANISKILSVIFNVNDKSSSDEITDANVKSIAQVKSVKNFIEVVTEGTSNDSALRKNMDVTAYTKNLYLDKIDQYILEKNHQIEKLKKEIIKIDTFDIKNLQEQIKLLEKDGIKKDEDKIIFLQKTELSSIESKISYHSKKLIEYTKEINKLNENSLKLADKTASMISSVQTLNYQNLILNSQNQLENLKVEKQILLQEKIPNLQRNINKIKNETIRKLQYKVDVELPEQKISILKHIESLEFSMSKSNIKNSELVGEYILHDYPAKPKKKLIIVVSFVTGFILSIFLVFFMEFVKNFRREAISK